MVDPDHAIQVCLQPGQPAKVCCSSVFDPHNSIYTSQVPGNGLRPKRKTLMRGSLNKMKPQKKRKLTIQSEKQEKENELPSIVTSPSSP